MTRPPWEVADIIRGAGDKFFEHYRDSLTWSQLKVLRAIERCRTAALGGHRDQCVRCGHQAISYNSCRNRHCPKCQTNTREKWLCARRRELLPVGYFHLVFSVPHTLVPLIWQNKRYLFGLLFDASTATLLEVAANPARLGAEVGFLSILHTWGQTLQRHPHVHCVVPAGGLSHKAAIAANSARFGQLDDYYILDEVTVYFGNGQTNVDPKYTAPLMALVQKAMTYNGYNIQVKGYASAVGNAAFNQELSEDRADNVTNILVQQGHVPLTNMLAPGAMGESRQIGNDKTEQGQAENRRVVVRALLNKGIAGTIQGLPTTTK